MKSSMNTIWSLFLVLSWTGFSQSEPESKVLTPGTKSNMLVRAGGIIRTPNTGAAIAVVSVQKKIPFSTIETKVGEMNSLLHLPFIVIDKPDAEIFTVVEDVLRGTNVAVVVAIYDAPLKPSLLVAPDARWTLINIASLERLGDKQDVVEARLGKQIWRGLCGVLGVGYSTQTNSIQQRINRIEDLDKIKNNAVFMDSFGAIFIQAARLGIQRSRISTYRKACEEGWAPMPTNAIQKAIWEEVKAKKK